MRRGFFRIFVVMSVLWFVFSGAISFNGVAQGLHDIKMFKRASEINQRIESIPKKQPLKWRDVVVKPEFQALSNDQKRAAQEQYFREVVAPQLPPEHHTAARNQFFSEFNYGQFASGLDAIWSNEKSAGDLRKKIATARQAGYSDDEIVQHLGSSQSFTDKLTQARNAGYSDDEIYKHLGLQVQQSAQSTIDQNKVVWDDQRLFGSLVSDVFKAKQAGYSDEDIHYYLYAFKDLGPKIDEYVKSNIRVSSWEQRKNAFNYLGLQEPINGSYRYLRAKKETYLGILTREFLPMTTIPIALLWILFYTVAWIAAGFRKNRQIS